MRIATAFAVITACALAQETKQAPSLGRIRKLGESESTLEYSESVQLRYSFAPDDRRFEHKIIRYRRTSCAFASEAWFGSEAAVVVESVIPRGFPSRDSYAISDEARLRVAQYLKTPPSQVNKFDCFREARYDLVRQNPQKTEAPSYEWHCYKKLLANAANPAGDIQPFLGFLPRSGWIGNRRVAARAHVVGEELPDCLEIAIATPYAGNGCWLYRLTFFGGSDQVKTVTWQAATRTQAGLLDKEPFVETLELLGSQPLCRSQGPFVIKGMATCPGRDLFPTVTVVLSFSALESALWSNIDRLDEAPYGFNIPVGRVLEETFAFARDVPRMKEEREWQAGEARRMERRVSFAVGGLLVLVGTGFLAEGLRRRMRRKASV